MFVLSSASILRSFSMLLAPACARPEAWGGRTCESPWLILEKGKVEEEEENSTAGNKKKKCCSSALLCCLLLAMARLRVSEGRERESRAARSKAEKARQAREKRERERERLVRKSTIDESSTFFFSRSTRLDSTRSPTERSRCRLSSTTVAPALAQEVVRRSPSLLLLHSLLQQQQLLLEPPRRSRSLNREERKEEDESMNRLETTMSRGPWSSQQQLLLLLPLPPRGPSLRKVRVGVLECPPPIASRKRGRTNPSS